VVLLVVFIGNARCSVPPPESTIEGVIMKHFESKKYKVMEIEIDEIKPIPLSEKSYMGVEGYLVNIPTLTLKAGEDSGEPWMYKKGQYLTFTNASIRIKKNDGQNLEWLIASISGISVP
jgi:hypothetical protein